MRGATLLARVAVAVLCLFQSTRPMRGATVRDDDLRHRRGISIHAPHAGRDPR